MLHKLHYRFYARCATYDRIDRSDCRGVLAWLDRGPRSRDLPPLAQPSCSQLCLVYRRVYQDSLFSLAQIALSVMLV